VSAAAAPAVLLVHGFSTSSERTWGETGWLDLLADEGRTVIAPDLLGHGTAPQPTDPAAYDQLEERVLDVLPPEPVDAVGFSLGARTVLVLASRHPQRFRRLVVAGVGANLFPPPESDSDGRSPIAGSSSDDGGDQSGGQSGDGADGADPVAAHFAQLAASSGCDPAALRALIARPNPPRLDAESFARITHPTLIVLGDRDFFGPADPLLAALPHAELVTLPGVDHFATPKAMRFLDAGLRFLA